MKPERNAGNDFARRLARRSFSEGGSFNEGRPKKPGLIKIAAVTLFEAVKRQLQAKELADRKRHRKPRK